MKLAMKEKIINFFSDVVKEMDKVTWPSLRNSWNPQKLSS